MVGDSRPPTWATELHGIAVWILGIPDALAPDLDRWLGQDHDARVAKDCDKTVHVARSHAQLERPPRHRTLCPAVGSLEVRVAQAKPAIGEAERHTARIAGRRKLVALLEPEQLTVEAE